MTDPIDSPFPSGLEAAMDDLPSPEASPPMVRTAFMCLVDFAHHIQDDAHGTTIFPDLETLKQRRTCISECGWVEVEVRVVDLTPPPKRSREAGQL